MVLKGFSEGILGTLEEMRMLTVDEGSVGAEFVLAMCGTWSGRGKIDRADRCGEVETVQGTCECRDSHVRGVWAV